MRLSLQVLRLRKNEVYNSFRPGIECAEQRRLLFGFRGEGRRKARILRGPENVAVATGALTPRCRRGSRPVRVRLRHKGRDVQRKPRTSGHRERRQCQEHGERIPLSSDVARGDGPLVLEQPRRPQEHQLVSTSARRLAPWKAPPAQRKHNQRKALPNRADMLTSAVFGRVALPKTAVCGYCWPCCCCLWISCQMRSPASRCSLMASP